MEAITNHVTVGARASGSVQGWSTSPGTGGAASPLQSVVGPNGVDEIVYSYTKGATTTGGPYYRETKSWKAGTYSVRLQIKAPAGRYVRLSISARDGSTTVLDNATPAILSTGQWQDLFVDGITVEADFTYFQLWPQHQGAAPAGEVMRVRNLAIFDGPVAVPYFDGGYGRIQDTGTLDWFVHRWTGAPGLSASVRERMSVSEWTRRWWGVLPSSYREIDAGMNGEIGGFPLLRYMDGPGQIAGGVRELSDLMWSGHFVDPETVPDYAIRWFAQMLGVPKSQRELDVDTLRIYLVDLVTQGRPAAGNRQSIVLAAKRFLSGDRQTIVQPSATAAHTILVLVRADEVPNNDTTKIVDGIRAAGVIPAGHDLQVLLAQTTWDAWESASGVSWSEYEALAATWSKSDSLGIQLE